MNADDAVIFVEEWVSENLNVTLYDDDAEAKANAAKCEEDGARAGYSKTALTKAAGGDLVAYMLSKQNTRVDDHVKYLASRDD